MKKIASGIKRAEEVLVVVLMIVMCVIIFVATVARFTNLFVISWAEELARYCMIWIVFLGIGVAAANGEHFCVEALNLFCPKKALQVIAIIKMIFTTGFCGFAAFWGFKITQSQIASGQVTPSLRIPMWGVYLAIPIGLIIMGLYYAYHTYETFGSIGESTESHEVTEALESVHENEEKGE